MSRTEKSVSLGALAEIAEGRLVQGDPHLPISGVAEIDKALEGQITYAIDQRYARRIPDSAAAAVVVHESLDPEGFDRPLILTRNPYWSFARILEVFTPETPPQDPPIHPLAWVHETATLGEGCVLGPHVTVEAHCEVGPGCVLEAGCFLGHHSRLGADCRIAPNVTIHRFSHLGDRVFVQSGTVIGGDGYGFVEKDGAHYKIPQIGNVVLEDDVEVGCNVTIDRATIGETRIERGSKIDNLVQIGHNVVLGEHSLLVSQVGISGSTVIGPRCRFAGQSGAAGHLTVGGGTTVAARGAVTKDLPERSFVSGFPARPHREERKIVASLPRLPDLVRRVRELERQLHTLNGENTPDTGADEEA